MQHWPISSLEKSKIKRYFVASTYFSYKTNKLLDGVCGVFLARKVMLQRLTPGHFSPWGINPTFVDKAPRSSSYFSRHGWADCVLRADPLSAQQHRTVHSSQEGFGSARQTETGRAFLPPLTQTPSDKQLSPSAVKILADGQALTFLFHFIFIFFGDLG